MNIDRRQRLEALPEWSWDVLSDLWEVGFSHLKQFSDREGHCRVPATYKTNDGYRLGNWVVNQRVTKDKIHIGRRHRLEALPDWSWDVLSDLWEVYFSHLKRFSERQGHCRVPATYKTDDGFGLKAWLQNQRKRKDTTNPDRRQRFALPGWSWDPHSDLWEDGFFHLKQFSEREGHCRVPQRYKSDDGYRLGQWTSNQKTNKDTMDSDRRKRLEATPGWSWDVLSDLWEVGFSHLKQFSDREGHCRVPYGYKIEDDYRLGIWVITQRRKKDLMNPDRQRRLEALPGWVWKVLEK
jgi:Helicase associated domain